MRSKLGGRFWAAMLIFGLMGQVAWVVENMYFNVFIYKMFHASAGEISAMVMASAVVAALTTIVMGAVSDRVGRRKAFMSVGYVIWGLTIVSFAWLGNVLMVIVMDCVMTFFGSTANDAAYNAWLTDRGDETNRGRIEGVNSMMPLVSILIVFGSFLSFDLERMASWRTIYYIIGAATVLIGVLGFFLIEEAPGLQPDRNPLSKTLIYSFCPSTMRQNSRLYLVLAAFALFGISIQIFMPYLLIYYEKTLGIENYVLILAPAIILAAHDLAGVPRIASDDVRLSHRNECFRRADSRSDPCRTRRAVSGCSHHRAGVHPRSDRSCHRYGGAPQCRADFEF